MEVRELTREEVKNKMTSPLTVGDLKKFIAEYNLPDNAVVVTERVQDFYYENNNWGVYLKKNEYTDKDADGNFVKDTMTQYTPAWCCVKYKDEDDILFIDLHY